MLNFTIRMLVALYSIFFSAVKSEEDANAQEIADIKKIYGWDRPDCSIGYLTVLVLHFIFRKLLAIDAPTSVLVSHNRLKPWMNFG